MGFGLYLHTGTPASLNRITNRGLHSLSDTDQSKSKTMEMGHTKLMIVEVKVQMMTAAKITTKLRTAVLI